jgi:hypothetical protein
MIGGREAAGQQLQGDVPDAVSVPEGRGIDPGAALGQEPARPGAGSPAQAEVGVPVAAPEAGPAGDPLVPFRELQPCDAQSLAVDLGR